MGQIIQALGNSMEGPTQDELQALNPSPNDRPSQIPPSGFYEMGDLGYIQRTMPDGTIISSKTGSPRIITLPEKDGLSGVVQKTMDKDMPNASLTFYNNQEDKYGSTTARANPVTGKAEAEEGVTIAVDPAVIPYGSAVYIPKLKEYSKNKDGIFVAHDTGGDVKKRVASEARGNQNPVIDVYTNSPLSELNKINSKYGDDIEYHVLGPADQSKDFGDIISKIMGEQ